MTDDRLPNPANRYAARLLRGLDSRVTQLEEAVNVEGVPGLLRSADDRTAIGETTTRTVNQGGTFNWGQTTWGSDTWD